jgi:hypothetical protein
MPVSMRHFLDPAVQEVYRLHSDAIMQTRTNAGLSGLGFPVAPLVQQQLSRTLSARQKGLIFNMVEADWKLLKSVPYVKLTQKEEQSLFQSLGTAEEVRAFEKAVAAGKPRKRSDKQAVSYYSKTILAPPMGIGRFFGRNPHGRKLLDRTVLHFINSFDLCMERVKTDRDNMQQCFMEGGVIEELVNLVFTGSDSHKGGNQVLFLDFRYRIDAKRKVQRIVYKPSDVEIDYPIAGNTNALGELLDRLGFVHLNQQLALFESDLLQPAAAVADLAGRVIDELAG